MPLTAFCILIYRPSVFNELPIAVSSASTDMQIY